MAVTRKIEDILAARLEPGIYASSSMFIFIVSGITTDPAVTDTYTNNSSTFTLRNVSLRGTAGSRLGFLIGERTGGSNDPAASGDLTRTAGAGDATIAFSAWTAGWTWNGTIIQSLGANDAMPYIDKGVKNTVLNANDDSIENMAFQDLPVQTGIESPIDSLSGNVRYDGMDHILYWMFGYEDGGDSPVNLGGSLYEHLFELDKHERHFTAYRTTEQTAGDYNAADRKNRAMTIAFKKGTNDHRYRHVYCNGFSFASSADDGIIKWTAKGISPREDRGSYSSSAWTFATAVQGSSNNVLHRQCTVSIKEQAGSFTALATSSFELNVDIPLKFDRDTESGLYLAEPVFEGKYGIEFSIILSRHTVDTYLAYRDDWSGAKLAVKVVATDGTNTFEVYMPEMRISDSSVSEDDVAQNPIVFVTGPVDADTADIFQTEIGSSVLIQKGNLFLITNNSNSVNEMRRA